MAILEECSRINIILEKNYNQWRKKLNTKGSVGKQGGGRSNNFCNKNQPNNANSHTRKLEELETATYIASQLSLADQYEKVTEEIIS